tara:strand:- start:394 stop:3288 length:2895 start_codon:yes stop_codon:yes gene_type:complete
MSNIAISRTSQFTTGGTLTASALETEFNNQFMHHQQHDQRLDRALLVPEHDTISGANLILPAKSSRLGKILSFNSSTGNPEMTFTVADGQTLSGVATDIALLADIQDGTSATNTLTNLSSISSNVTTVAGISANVTTVAGISSNVTTVAGKASLITSDFASDMALINSSFVTQMNLVTSDFVSDVNTLATSDIVSDINLLATTDVISDLNTLATSDIVSDLNTLATSDIVSDINTLATSDIVSDLNTLATSDIVSDINTLATSDIVTDLALLATSDFVSDLNTMATSSNVSNLNTVAGAVTNVNNVGGSISNVNTVASNISGVNSFAERYRVASSAPTSSLDVGDLYFDTTANEVKVYKSSGWANVGSTVNGTSARFTYNISGTPTSVTGADANGNTLAYEAGFCDVYLNGVRLSGADITITSGDTVTFASALANGDLVDIVAFGTFSVANIVSTGALNSGSITSGFGNIDTGSSTITTTGAISGGALSGTSLDLNGGELILDSDNDTSITSDTDDRVDIKVAGSDVVHVTSTGLGVGTTSIGARLHVDTAVAGYAGKFVNDNTATDANGLLIQAGSASTEYALNVANTAGSTNFLVVKGDGKVGVGKNLPDGNLDITGSGNTDVYINTGNNSGDNSRIFFGDTADIDVGFVSYDHGTNAMLFGVNAVEALRIDTSQRLLVGSSSVTAVPVATTARNPQAEIVGSLSGSNHHGSLSLRCTNDGAVLYLSSALTSGNRTAGSLCFLLNDGTDYHAGAKIECQNDATTGNNDTPGRLVFSTTDGGASSPTERARISRGGTFLVGSTSGTISQSAFGFRVDQDGFTTLSKNAASGTSVTEFFGASGKFQTMGDGDAENSSGRFSSISDERYKENIVDANSQWDDIKAIKVRNYNFKEEKGWGTHKQIGVVAQELEASGMTGGLVKTKDDGYKSVATSVLYMKAVKALQEAMTRIETLEAEVKTLKGE